MNKQLKIKLFSYDHAILEQSVKKIIEIGRNNGCDISGPIPLPTKREIWTICKSPHVNKSSREQFERRTHKRLIVLSKVTDQTKDNLRRLSMPSGVDIKIIL